jgi:hypothetical protein
VRAKAPSGCQPGPSAFLYLYKTAHFRSTVDKSNNWLREAGVTGLARLRGGPAHRGEYRQAAGVATQVEGKRQRRERSAHSLPWLSHCCTAHRHSVSPRGRTQNVSPRAPSIIASVSREMNWQARRRASSRRQRSRPRPSGRASRAIFETISRRVSRETRMIVVHTTTLRLCLRTPKHVGDLHRRPRSAAGCWDAAGVQGLGNHAQRGRAV